MPKMLRHQNLSGIDLLRRAISIGTSGAQVATAFRFGINGNTAASIAMTASRLSSNMCQRAFAPGTRWSLRPLRVQATLSPKIEGTVAELA